MIYGNALSFKDYYKTPLGPYAIRNDLERCSKEFGFDKDKVLFFKTDYGNGERCFGWIYSDIKEELDKYSQEQRLTFIDRLEE